MSGMPLHKEEGKSQDKASVKSLLVGLNEAFKSVPSQVEYFNFNRLKNLSCFVE